MSVIKYEVGKIIDMGDYSFEILERLPNRKVKVKFSPGNEVCTTQIHNLLSRSKSPSYIVEKNNIKRKKEHIEEKYIGIERVKNGVHSKIVSYNYDTKKAIIEFDTGERLEKDVKEYMRRGACKKVLKELNVGDSNVMKCGMKATIVAYRKYNDIDIEFENGDIVKTAGKEFKLGNVSYKGYDYHENHKKSMIGKIFYNKNGERMTIVEYNNKNDLKIKFDNGFVKKADIARLKKGVVIQRTHDCVFGKEKIGESKIMNCGEKVTIIAYDEKRKARKYLFKFENGKEMWGDIGAFNKKKLSNKINALTPSYKNGDKIELKNGEIFTITNYENARNINGIFMDGTEKKTKSYLLDCKSTKHPILGKESLLYFGFKTKSTRINKYYKCNCTKCNLEAIMTPQEMIKHREICNG